MFGKMTIDQKDEGLKKETERKRLLEKSKEVLKMLADETSKNAVDVLNYLIGKINAEHSKRAEKEIIKDLWPDDFKT